MVRFVVLGGVCCVVVLVFAFFTGPISLHSWIFQISSIGCKDCHYRNDARSNRPKKNVCMEQIRFWIRFYQFGELLQEPDASGFSIRSATDATRKMAPLYLTLTVRNYVSIFRRSKLVNQGDLSWRALKRSALNCVMQSLKDISLFMKGDVDLRSEGAHSNPW